MTFCLISISCLNKAGCSLLIEDQQCIICGPQPKHTVIGSVPLIQGLYRATSSITSPKPNLQLNLNSSHPTTLDDLYCKLRHIGYQNLLEITNNSSISRIDIDFPTEPKFCTACIQGKAQWKSFPKESQTEYTKYGEKTVMDLWGPAQVELLGGNCYYHLHHNMYV